MILGICHGDSGGPLMKLGPNNNYEVMNSNINQISFAQHLANLISNEINRDRDFSGNIQIELGLSGR